MVTKETNPSGLGETRSASETKVGGLQLGDPPPTGKDSGSDVSPKMHHRKVCMYVQLCMQMLCIHI